jgi:hypothetical protein
MGATLLIRLGEKDKLADRAMVTKLSSNCNIVNAKLGVVGYPQSVLFSQIKVRELSP